MSNDDKLRDELIKAVKDIEGARDALTVIRDRIEGGA